MFHFWNILSVKFREIAVFVKVILIESRLTTWLKNGEYLKFAIYVDHLKIKSSENKIFSQSYNTCMWKNSGQKSQNWPSNRAKQVFHTCQYPAPTPNKYNSYKNLNSSSKRLTDPNFLWFNAFMTSKRLHPGPLCPQEADTQLQKKYNWPLYGLKGQSGLKYEIS